MVNIGTGLKCKVHTYMFNKMVRIRVMCMIAFVNMRVRMRYMAERIKAAPVTNKSRMTVWLNHK